jgi:hypothetical protein
MGSMSTPSQIEQARAAMRRLPYAEINVAAHRLYDVTRPGTEDGTVPTELLGLLNAAATALVMFDTAIQRIRELQRP